MKVQICTTPNKGQLIEIKNWLNEENQKYKKGFFCNWRTIERYFESNELIILVKDSNVIGFSTYHLHNEIVVNIDIAEIHPDHRGLGYGKFMMNEIFNYCKNHGVLVAKLFCEPTESYDFWKRLGFLDVPQIGYIQPEFSMYMTLIVVRENLKDDFSDQNIIELWDCEPHNSKVIQAKWTWSTNAIQTKIEPPILVACNRNWNIRHSINGVIKKESKVKYFSNTNPIDLDIFMFITELSTYIDK